MVYGVIVALWAVVLVPMWIRRHDATNESRSADRFSQAMRTLSPRPTAGQRELVMPARPQAATRPLVTGSGDRRVSARSRQARRRLRVLLALVATVAALGVLAVLGVVPWVAAAVPVLLLVVYVVSLAQQAKRARAARRPRRRPAAPGTRRREPAGARPVADDSSVVVETKGRTRPWQTVAARAPDQRRSAPAAVATVPATEPAAPPQAAEPDPISAVATDDETWQPARFPLPTYVTAPKAVRPVRVIDLTSPGAWTSGRFLDEPVPEADEAIAQAQEAADELNALLDRRPAVND